ncbi:MAG: TetR family transcriptional regulator C-terminal domain-containing protein [Candidatus Tectomicrobia bacterium]|uniref:TetR family transcriptional regulator C-terminal domain-containing protein n=1 Tax=Tectimicrobiota bacterium TaxID=2528274 RepID=A0A933GPA7_UNCTE|nr:TetR family transcriptional regulator C-terminal domain-containing protein [Candidatus Tectomicrobia bacterium]
MAANSFFVQWYQLLNSLFEEAKKQGKLRKNADCKALSHLIMSTVEGAILICKASKDSPTLRKTLETLKSVLF